jgi:RNA polymerase sigma factor FliA
MDSEEKKLWKRMAAAKRKSTVERLRNELVERYLPLCATIATRLAKNTPGVGYDDLYAAGYVGLLNAVPRFDIDRGSQPETFFTWRIKGEIRDYLRNQDTVSRATRQRINRVKEWEQRELGRPATDEEINAHFGFHDREPYVVSLDRKLSDTGLFSDLAADAKPIGDISDLAALMRGLNKRERIIALQCFIEGDTMKQVAAQLGLSESRISQMMPAIISRIKRNAA